MIGIVSFSLYGQNPMYSIGAIENAKLMHTVYPGWIMKVYHSADVKHDVISTLSNFGCELALMPNNHDGKFWRFEAISDNRAKYTIFRDCDSRINYREAAAVQAWVESGKIIHTMKDHPDQDKYPILAGMWGIINGSIDIMKLLSDWKYDGNFYDDQVFLENLVWPLVQHSSIRHGRFGVPFPQHKPCYGFVGQRFTQDNKPLPC